MSALGRPSRTRRARPLLVRDGLRAGDVGALVDSMQDRLRTSANLYDAVCEVSNAGPRDPISVVLVGEPTAGTDFDAVVRSFRRIDPSVRLIALVDDATSPAAERAIEAGFDDVLGAPFDATRIDAVLEQDQPSRAPSVASHVRPRGAAIAAGSPIDARADIDDAEAGPPAPPARDRPHDRASDGDESSSAQAGGPNAEAVPAEPGSLVEVVLEQAWSRLAPERAAAREAATRREAGASFPSPRRADETVTDAAAGSARLGDVDMVAAVRAGRGVAEMALALIRQHLEIEDVELALLAEPDAGGPRGHAVVPVESDGKLFGHLVSNAVDGRTLDPWARWTARWLELDAEMSELRAMAWTDMLTGAGNRRAFEDLLNEVLERAAREWRYVTLMYFDIDNFKTYNDRFGHEAGDEVLRETVQLLKSVIRRGDHVFRIGGDEFVVIFADPTGPRTPNSTPPDSIEEIAQRFQQQLASMCLPQIGLDAPGTLSISAGLVTFPWDGRSPRELLNQADELAMESKRCGKNAITFGPGARSVCRR